MADPRFYRREGPFTATQLADRLALAPVSSEIELCDLAGLDDAAAGDVSFFSNAKLSEKLATTHASAVLLKPEHADLCPDGCLPLVCDDPYRAMAKMAQLFYPDTAAARPAPHWRQNGHAVHPSARLGADVTVEPGAVIGPHADIGDGCHIAPGAVIGHGVTLGRGCSIGPNANVQYALLGDRVIIHGGTQIGVDGFGFAPGASHIKIPQLGRVILQADVEIGGNCAIDRGALGDTVIGEGSKLDNLNHIAHNVVMGRHCFMTACCAIAGSTVLGDYVQMGGGAKVTGHVRIGDRCVISAQAAVLRSFPADTQIAGNPARVRGELYREQAFISRLHKQASKPDADSTA